jgi:hypothetical protein
MSENDERATSVGQTAGLPGANADPETEILTEDEQADTVSMLGTADGGNSDEEGETASNA